MAPPAENGALSARTVLEVADGLRWSDPRLGVSLAEHAVRLAGDDAAVRSAAERSVIRSLAEVDRFDEVVARATPLLEDAVVRGDRDDLAGLLVELAAAAVGFGDHAVAAHLVEPVGPGDGLPDRTVAKAALVRAQLAGVGGDVPGADRTASEAEAALQHTDEPEAGLVRRDLARARAAARRRSGDAGAALPIVSAAVSADPRADADGGRRSLLAAADQIDLLLDLGRSTEALERARTILPADPTGPLVVGAVARIRLALAERVHLTGGAPREAQTAARAAADQLESAGHDAAAARAWQVVASAAERSGDLGAALTAVRYGHDLESRSRDRRDPSLRVLTMIAASAPELPARPTRAAEPAAPEPPGLDALGLEASGLGASGLGAQEEPGTAPAPGSSTLSEFESLLADARSSLTDGHFGGADGTATLPQRRGHHRHDAVDTDPPAGSETVPEALARLLGDTGPSTDPGGGTSPHGPGERVNGSRAVADGAAGDSHVVDGAELSASPPPGSDRRSEESRDDPLAEPPDGTRADTGSRPTFDVFSSVPGRRPDPAGPEAGPSEGPGLPGAEPFSSTAGAPEGGRSSAARWDPTEFPHIDPRDPLGADSSADVGAGRAAPAAGRPGNDHDEAFSRPAPQDPQPLDRPVSRGASGERDRRGPDTAAPEPGRSPYDGGGRELDDELALTLAGLLAEYRVPDAPQAPQRDPGRSADVAVPTARPHVSGSMPLPSTDQRFAPRPADAPGRIPPSDPAATGGRARRGENGARLADLLAEAMDAFRHTGAGDGSPDVDGPARSNGGPVRGNGNGASAPGVGVRRR